MNVTAHALRRPVTVLMVYTCLGLIGVLASRLLPLEYLPDIDFPGVVIEIPYSNSSPEDVERRITRPVEEILATMSGVKRMRSESRESGAFIILFFNWGQDISTKGVEAIDKVDSVRHRLPADIERVTVRKWAANETPIISVRISSDRDLSTAHDMLNRHLTRRIERLEGVSKVELYGVKQREIRIELSAARVTAHKVDLNALQQRLKDSNFSLSAGHITDQNQRLFVHPEGEFRSLDDIRNLIITGNGLRLSDVAEIRYTVPEPTDGRRLNQRYAIGLNVYKENGANLVAVSDHVLKEIDAVSQLPKMAGINLYFTENQGEGVRDSLSQLLRAGLIGALLSVLVLYFFLRQLNVTLIVTLAVPFSIMVTLAAMYFLGFTLNILTLMGLMLSIGMLVDNAVVVTESIFRHRQQHPQAVNTATLSGVRDIGTAVLAGTLTSIIVFLPNILGEQIQTTLFLSHVAVTICIALAASLIISQTLIPLLTTRITPKPITGAGNAITRFTTQYTKLLDWTLRHRAITLLVTAGILASIAIPLQVVEQDLFPEDETRNLLLRYNLNNQYTLEKAAAAVDIIENHLFAHKAEFEIESVYSYYNTGRAISIIRLTHADEAVRATPEIKTAIRDSLPKIAIGQPSFENKRIGGSKGLAIQLIGESNERLAVLAKEVARTLEHVKGLRDVRVDTGPEDWEVRVIIHRERTRLHGLSSETVARAVAAAMRGQKLRPYRGDNGEVEIRLQFQASDRADLDQLLQIPIQTPNGGFISLNAVARLDIGSVPGKIVRENRVTAVKIKTNLVDITPTVARQAIETVMQQIALPAGYGWRFGQAFDEEQKSAQVMMINMVLAVAMIYIVMAALFESLLLPLSIISGIVFSIIGVYWFFLLTGTTFSIMAMIGVLVLMGVVVNNGIVLIDHINHLRWNGMARRAAILQGTRDRLRPILMTVGTTVLGLIPLSIGDAQIGGDGPPYYPMARAIVGGLLFSSVVSLIALPTLYTLLDDLSVWARRVYREANTPVTIKLDN